MSTASGFLTDEQRKLMRSLSHGRDIIPEERKFTRSSSHGQHAMLDIVGSPDKHERSIAKLVSVGSGELKKDRHSHSGRNGRPKKGDFPCGSISEVWHLKQIILFHNLYIVIYLSCSQENLHTGLLLAR